MKRVCDFVVENMQTIGLIYLIVAVVVFAGINIYFWTLSFNLEEDIYKEIRYGGCYFDKDEVRFEKWILRATGMIISIPAALLWLFIPIILGALMLYDTMQEKNPELFGFDADEFDKEEKK